ncbi:MAG: hypothetical protein JXR66_09840 [Bacteroidales bacterium]|nr:hypothetical protein [Bacteroidales bacterium]
MKKLLLIIAALVLQTAITSAQNTNTRLFTIFTSAGCGCTGSGGAPLSFTTHEQILHALQEECTGVDFIEFKGSITAAFNEVNKNKNKYDGVLIIGRVDNDYRLAFTGLPTIVVYNLWEFQSGHHYHIFATGKVKDDDKNILEGGTNYQDVKILTAQLDRRNLCAPPVRESMFNDLVYKINLIKTVKELKETRILMIRSGRDEIIASVNYKAGDYNQKYPADHNERYLRNFRDLFGIEIVVVEAEEFYETYGKIDPARAEEVADEWIRGARTVEASRAEIIKSARGYLAIDALRGKYNCNAVSTHVRSVTGNNEIKDRYNPGLGFELGFKTRGIQAVCQNYPDILISQVLAYLLTGRPSMLGDQMYDIDNSVEIVLHCGIPVNPYGDDRRMPYTITTHAESPVRDRPEIPGSSTGMRAEWPVGEPVTFWEIHSIIGQIRLHTGQIIDGHSVYTGGENIDNVMCTAKVIARVDNIKKVRDQHFPSLYGIHHCITMGDLRQQIIDVATLLGLNVIERDRPK